jgi:hypothetical protein
MKVTELLENQEDMMNMRDALSDVSAQQLVQIEEDPMAYAQQTGQQIQPEQAQEIMSVLSAVDDKTFDLISNSPVIIQSMEDSAMDGGEPFIGIDALMQVLSRAKARMK